jgi:pyridoxine kinase
MPASSSAEQLDILSIQSGVMVGAVGNDAAGPIYAQRALSVARLDTVRLAAHPGHGAMRAYTTPPDTLSELLSDFFSLPQADDLKLIQTGYFGAAEQVSIVADHIRSYRNAHPTCQFLCDPVLGDSGRLYVDAAIKDEIEAHLLPLADYLTPNLFELSSLTGTLIKTCDDAFQSADALLSKQQLSGCRAILVTGVPHSDGTITDCLVTRKSQDVVHTSATTGGISGSGDILAALMIAHLLSYPDDDIASAAKAACVMTSRLMAQATSHLTMPVKLS